MSGLLHSPVVVLVFCPLYGLGVKGAYFKILYSGVIDMFIGQGATECLVHCLRR